MSMINNIIPVSIALVGLVPNTILTLVLLGRLLNCNVHLFDFYTFSYQAKKILFIMHLFSVMYMTNV